MLHYSNLQPSQVEKIFYEYVEKSSNIFKLREFPCSAVEVQTTLISDSTSSSYSGEDLRSSSFPDESKLSSSITGVSLLPTTVHSVWKKRPSIPTFRGFVVAVVFEKLMCNNDMACMAEVDVHHRGLVARCAPCQVNYDGIIQVNREKS